jgi:hypothetical protein
MERKKGKRLRCPKKFDLSQNKFKGLEEVSFQEHPYKAIGAGFYWWHRGV